VDPRLPSPPATEPAAIPNRRGSRSHPAATPRRRQRPPSQAPAEGRSGAEGEEGQCPRRCCQGTGRGRKAHDVQGDDRGDDGEAILGPRPVAGRQKPLFTARYFESSVPREPTPGSRRRNAGKFTRTPNAYALANVVALEAPRGPLFRWFARRVKPTRQDATWANVGGRGPTARCRVPNWLANLPRHTNLSLPVVFAARSVLPTPLSAGQKASEHSVAQIIILILPPMGVRRKGAVGFRREWFHG